MAELNAVEFASDRDAAYQAAKDAGKRVRTGKLTIRQVSVPRLEAPQVSPDTETGSG